jgi:hypothetical protein
LLRLERMECGTDATLAVEGRRTDRMLAGSASDALREVELCSEG